jgi:hypothetical protein
MGSISNIICSNFNTTLVYFNEYEECLKSIRLYSEHLTFDLTLHIRHAQSREFLACIETAEQDDDDEWEGKQHNLDLLQSKIQYFYRFGCIEIIGFCFRR